MREITDGVFVEDRYSLHGDYHGCNYGYVETGDGLVAIDTPEWPADAVPYRDRLAEAGSVRYLVNTHQHIDHVAGNHFVPGERISHDCVRAAISIPPEYDRTRSLLGHLFEDDLAKQKIATVEEWGPDGFDWEDLMRLIFADLDPESLEHLDGYEMAPPEVTFNDTATLHVGECTFELLHMPGHVESHIAVYIPEKSVLFAGDNVTTECYPSMASAVPQDWLASLDRLANLDLEHVVPGHGPVAGPEAITSFRSFLETVRDRVEAATAERSVENAVTALDFTDLRPALHPMALSHRDDVERLYEVLS
ncbi:MAG: MBL fold metallo-hydrolase [Salinirussus sp.]